ncbi:MAG TPA: hypothetical protein VF514_01000, partial [Bacteroidota bacterium]
EMIRRCATDGGIAVVYGHPHSIHMGNAQDVRQLVPLMRLIRSSTERGALHPALPRELLGEE